MWLSISSPAGSPVSRAGSLRQPVEDRGACPRTKQSALCWKAQASLGSFPRVRGTGRRGVPIRRDRRFLPAHAENRLCRSRPAGPCAPGNPASGRGRRRRWAGSGGAGRRAAGRPFPGLGSPRAGVGGVREGPDAKECAAGNVPKRILIALGRRLLVILNARLRSCAPSPASERRRSAPRTFDPFAALLRLRGQA